MEVVLWNSKSIKDFQCNNVYVTKFILVMSATLEETQITGKIVKSSEFIDNYQHT